MIRNLSLLLTVFALLSASLRAANCDDPVLARMELSAPAHSEFVLHGTMPVPPGAFADDPDLASIAVECKGRGKRVAPAQVEVVSRYPDGTPDVVEVLARVSLPEATRPGSPVRFDVVRHKHATASEPTVPKALTSLLSEPGQITLRARDVFGNRYTLDLAGNEEDPGFGSERVLKSGLATRQVRVYGTLAPTLADKRDKKALPHLMGAHAYLSTWAEEPFLNLDLRVNNGAIAGSRAAHELETTLGIVYFKELELVVPKGWIVVPKVRDPFWQRAYVENERMVYPLVRGNDDGSLHMMGPQAQFLRRLVIAPLGTRNRAKAQHDGLGHAFCVRGDGLWSWFNEETARYFPQRHVLASLDFWKRGKGLGKANVRAADWRKAHELKQVLETGKGGSGYAVADVMGWAHPWFIRIEGGAGGEGIAMFEGYRAAGAASVGDYLRLELLHRMNMSRQPEAAYDRFGDPVGYHAWLGADGKIPFDFRTNAHIVPPAFQLPMRGGPPASEHVREVVKRKLRPSYDRGRPFDKDGRYPGDAAVQLAWSPHDGQHMIRYTKNTKALVWLGNDSLAKDDLLLSAELFHLMWHESDHVPVSWSKGITLKLLSELAKEHPHTGIHVNRDHAWGIDSMCAAYSVAPETWRERNYSWFKRVADLLDLAAMPSGIVQRNEVNSKILGHSRYAAAQGFEVLFMIHSMRAMTESVFRGVDSQATQTLESLAIKTVEYLFWGPVFQRFQTPYQPDPKNPTRFVYGPLAAIPVALNDKRATPPFSDAEHWGKDYLPLDFTFKHVDTTYVWEALSYAHDITNGKRGSDLNNRYLRRAIHCGPGYDSASELLRGFYDQTGDPSVEDSKNWIGLVGKLQNLGVR